MAQHPDFPSFINKEWKCYKFTGRGNYVLKEKLRQLNISLKKWNIDVFGWIDLKVDTTMQKLNDLDFQVSNLDISIIDKLALRRELASAEVWNHLNLKEGLLRHKSRALWLKEGDRNYSFFHKVMKVRYIRNFISFVNTPEGRKEKVGKIKSKVCNYFEANFLEGIRSRTVLNGVDVIKLLDEDSLSI